MLHLQARKEPLGAIGLQACKLMLAESDMISTKTFEAQRPWWSAENNCT